MPITLNGCAMIHIYSVILEHNQKCLHEIMYVKLGKMLHYTIVSSIIII